METAFCIYCGSEETMRRYAARGVKAINPRTHRWQIIDKDACYEVVNVQHHISDEGQPYTIAELYADRDLKAIAKEKGLIF